MEKPDHATAEQFLATGRFTWNSGMFLFRASGMLAELERLTSEVVSCCRAALEQDSADLGFHRLEREAFATVLKQEGGRLLQISTDFVFNGTQGRPYQPEQTRNPLGVYGASKAAGEAAVQSIFWTEGRGLILRTSWVIGPVGKNFALTMLRLHRERDQLGVIADSELTN